MSLFLLCLIVAQIVASPLESDGPIGVEEIDHLSNNDLRPRLNPLYSSDAPTEPLLNSLVPECVDLPTDSSTASSSSLESVPSPRSSPASTPSPRSVSTRPFYKAPILPGSPSSVSHHPSNSVPDCTKCSQPATGLAVHQNVAYLSCGHVFHRRCFTMMCFKHHVTVRPNGTLYGIASDHRCPQCVENKELPPPAIPHDCSLQSIDNIPDCLQCKSKLFPHSPDNQVLLTCGHAFHEKCFRIRCLLHRIESPVQTYDEKRLLALDHSCPICPEPAPRPFPLLLEAPTQPFESVSSNALKPSVVVPKIVLPDPIEAQLKAEGLYRHRIAADGNCLFAAIADQLTQLHPERSYHSDEIRKQTVDYIHQHREHFEPFLAGENLDSYCERMSRPGDVLNVWTWGGHFELQATLRVYDCEIVIHEAKKDKLVLSNADADQKPSTTLHLAFGGSHYDSCRRIETVVESDPADDASWVVDYRFRRQHCHR